MQRNVRNLLIQAEERAAYSHCFAGSVRGDQIDSPDYLRFYKSGEWCVTEWVLC